MTTELKGYVYSREITNELISCVTNKTYKHTNIPKFVFLCGKGLKNKHVLEQLNREIVINFYGNIGRDDVCFIYAEKLWDLEKTKNIDLLTFEHILAELCDGIIIFVESYGSACELGAFSMETGLINKMLVFVDKKYKDEKSFINEGPVKKINDTNDNFVLYVNLNSILSDSLVYDKLKGFVSTKKCIPNRDSQNVLLNSFIIEYLEIISLFGPIHFENIIEIYKIVKGFTTFRFQSPVARKISIKNIVDLLIESKLIRRDGDYLSLVKPILKEPFMFDMTPRQYNSIRARILTKKYKHQEGIIA